MMKSNITTITKAIVLGLVLSVGVGYLSAAWTEAPPNPPASNTDAPINIGPGLQAKGSASSAGHLTLFGRLTASFFTLLDGTPGDDAGKVLTSDANGNGTWQTPTGGGASVTLVSGTPTPSYSPEDWTSVVTLANSTAVKACFLTQVDHYNTDSGNNFFCEIRPPSVSGTPGLWQLVSTSHSNENTMCKAMCIQ